MENTRCYKVIYSKVAGGIGETIVMARSEEEAIEVAKEKRPNDSDFMVVGEIDPTNHKLYGEE